MRYHLVPVKVERAERARIRKQNEAGTIPVSPFYRTCYLPRKNEMTAPRIPISAKPRMTKPIGTRDPIPAAGSKLRVASGGGGVKVGRRVGVI